MLNLPIFYVNTILLPVLCTSQLWFIILGKKFGSRCLEMGCWEDISIYEEESNRCSEKISIQMLVYLLICVVAAQSKMLLENLILPHFVRKFHIFFGSRFFHYLAHKYPPMKQMNPVQTLSSQLFKNIAILPFHPMFRCSV